MSFAYWNPWGADKGLLAPPSESVCDGLTYSPHLKSGCILKGLHKKPTFKIFIRPSAKIISVFHNMIWLKSYGYLRVEIVSLRILNREESHFPFLVTSSGWLNHQSAVLSCVLRNQHVSFQILKSQVWPVWKIPVKQGKSEESHHSKAQQWGYATLSSLLSRQSRLSLPPAPFPLRMVEGKCVHQKLVLSCLKWGSGTYPFSPQPLLLSHFLSMSHFPGLRFKHLCSLFSAPSLPLSWPKPVQVQSSRFPFQSHS